MSAIYRMALAHAFRVLEQNDGMYRGEGLSGVISLTCFEIYNGNIHDLLDARRRCAAREDKDGKVHVVGLQEIVVQDVDEGLEVIEHGVGARATGTTAANADSSRSHALFRIHVRLKACRAPGGILVPARETTITMIDLAGSERASERARSSKLVKQEAAEINKSLLALKECIRSLRKREALRSGAAAAGLGANVNGAAAVHIPYRTSVLTHILQDAFASPASNIAVIVAVSPGSGSCDHTLNSLRYAARLKAV